VSAKLSIHMYNHTSHIYYRINSIIMHMTKKCNIRVLVSLTTKKPLSVLAVDIRRVMTNLSNLSTMG
jgi:hypothetical protein